MEETELLGRGSDGTGKNHQHSSGESNNEEEESEGEESEEKKDNKKVGKLERKVIKLELKLRKKKKKFDIVKKVYKAQIGIKEGMLKAEDLSRASMLCNQKLECSVNIKLLHNQLTEKGKELTKEKKAKNELKTQQTIQKRSCKVWKKH